MKLELNNKEVAEVGQNRWTRKYWKRIVVINGGLLVAVFAVIVPISILDIKGEEYISCTLMTLWLIIYGITLLRINRAGKRFLKEQQQ